MEGEIDKEIRGERSDKGLYISILLVEDNPADARLVEEMIQEAGPHNYKLKHVERTDEALKCLSEETFDVILLDLTLPDTQGLNTLNIFHTEAPSVAIVVLTGLADEALGIKALQRGAQDYLVKGQVDSNLLVRSIRYAVERHQMQEKIYAMSLVDELTGVYNRRGFLTLAKQQLKTANRIKKDMYLVFADMDNLKWINDALGHQKGDQALIDTANIFAETCRESDIIARIGGDEFAVLVLPIFNDSIETISARLQEHLKIHNAKRKRTYRLSLSIGITCYDPNHPCSINELLVRADMLMYKEKQRKQNLKNKTHKSENIHKASM
ncbi:MAG: diguanylate cyclase [Thermodesulfobacteriota bacterium]